MNKQNWTDQLHSYKTWLTNRMNAEEDFDIFNESHHISTTIYTWNWIMSYFEDNESIADMDLEDIASAIGGLMSDNDIGFDRATELFVDETDFDIINEEAEDEEIPEVKDPRKYYEDDFNGKCWLHRDGTSCVTKWDDCPYSDWCCGSYGFKEIIDKYSEIILAHPTLTSAEIKILFNECDFTKEDGE